jgi:hypothetical protein
MLTTTILVLVTLAAAIVGTILNPSRWVKALVIALAVASAVATIAVKYDDFREQQFDRGALAALLASSSPSPDFTRALQQSVNRVAREHDLVESFTTIKDQGAVYAFHRMGADSDDVNGVFAMTNEDRASAFLKFIAGESLDPVAKHAMFDPEPSALGDAWELSTERLLDHLGFIGNVALDENVSWITSNTMITIKIGQISPSSAKSNKVDTRSLICFDSGIVESRKGAAA